MQKLREELEVILKEFNGKMKRIYADPKKAGNWYRDNLKQVAEDDIKSAFNSACNAYLAILKGNIKAVELKTLTQQDFADIGAKMSLYKTINGSITTEFIKHIVSQYSDYELNEFKALCVDIPNNKERELAFLDYEAQFKDFKARSEDYRTLEKVLNFDAMIQPVNGFLELKTLSYSANLSAYNLENGVVDA